MPCPVFQDARDNIEESKIWFWLLSYKHIIRKLERTLWCSGQCALRHRLILLCYTILPLSPHSDLKLKIQFVPVSQIDLQTFLTLTDQDLKELGITTFGARRKMLLAISGQFPSTQSTGASIVILPATFHNSLNLYWFHRSISQSINTYYYYLIIFCN